MFDFFGRPCWIDLGSERPRIGPRTSFGEPYTDLTNSLRETKYFLLETNTVFRDTITPFGEPNISFGKPILSFETQLIPFEERLEKQMT